MTRAICSPATRVPELTWPDRSRGERRVVVVARLGCDLCCRHCRHSQAGEVLRAGRVDRTVVQPPVRLDVEDLEHLTERQAGCHGPQPAREHRRRVDVDVDVDVVGGGHSTVVPNAHPSAQTGSSRRATPVAASIASAEHTGAGCVTTASELITVGTAAVSAAPAVELLTAAGGPSRVIPMTRLRELHSTTQVAVSSVPKQAPTWRPPIPAGWAARIPSSE